MFFRIIKRILLILSLMANTAAMAQQDAYLKELVGVVENLRNANGKKQSYNNAVNILSQQGKPKITLMDDLGNHQNEYIAANNDKFRLNAVVTYAYSVQNGTNLSKGNYFDSRQLGVKYSLYEKNVKPGKTVAYQLTGHRGRQEFVVVPFQNNAKYNTSISYDGNNNAKVEKNINVKNYSVFTIDKVQTDGKINITIENKGNVFESFAIINYNERK